MLIAIFSLGLLITAFIVSINEVEPESGVSKSLAFWVYAVITSMLSLIFYFVDAVISVIKERSGLTKVSFAVKSVPKPSTCPSATAAASLSVRAGNCRLLTAPIITVCLAANLPVVWCVNALKKICVNSKTAITCAAVAMSMLLPLCRN